MAYLWTTARTQCRVSSQQERIPLSKTLLPSGTESSENGSKYVGRSVLQ